MRSTNNVTFRSCLNINWKWNGKSDGALLIRCLFSCIVYGNEATSEIIESESILFTRICWRFSMWFVEFYSQFDSSLRSLDVDFTHFYAHTFFLGIVANFLFYFLCLFDVDFSSEMNWNPEWNQQIYGNITLRNYCW